MKNILFAIALVMTMSFGASAQRGSDSFFSYDNGFEDRMDMNDPNGLLGLPSGAIGGIGNQDAPLGSGLLVLTALGAGYAVARKRKR